MKCIQATMMHCYRPLRSDRTKHKNWYVILLLQIGGDAFLQTNTEWKQGSSGRPNDLCPMHVCTWSFITSKKKKKKLQRVDSHKQHHLIQHSSVTEQPSIKSKHSLVLCACKLQKHTTWFFTTAPHSVISSIWLCQNVKKVPCHKEHCNESHMLCRHLTSPKLAYQ